MKILIPKWCFFFSKLTCLRLTVMNTNLRQNISLMEEIVLRVSEGRYVQCTITPCYSMSPDLWKSTLLFLYLCLAVMISCLKKKSASHMGPLYWFPDKCCLIPGHEPAASPSFLHTTWGSMRFSSSSCLTLASSCLT